jgi:hypothetical protein
MKRKKQSEAKAVSMNKTKSLPIAISDIPMPCALIVNNALRH